MVRGKIWVDGELMVDRRYEHAVDEIEAAIRAGVGAKGSVQIHYDLRSWPDEAVAAAFAELG